MFHYFYIFLGLVGLLGIIAIAWRFSSLRISIPCPSWLHWLVELDNPIFRNNRAKVIIQHLALEPGMVVLDYGCGPGRLSIPLAKSIGSSGRVTAFDIQEEMLHRVAQKAKKENLDNIDFTLAGVESGKLAKEQYDRVILVTVLGEIPDKLTALQEIFTCLKPRGILSITEVIADPHFQRYNTIKKIALSAGFAEYSFYGNRISFTANFIKP